MAIHPFTLLLKLPLLLLLLLSSPSPSLGAPKPSYTTCPPSTFSDVPRDWSNGTAVISTRGWHPGRYLDYFDKAHGRSLAAVIKNVFASTCYKKAVCEYYNQAVKYISWQSITNKGTKGLCLLFGDSTCNPMYAPQVKGTPYQTNLPNWFSTYVGFVPESIDCDI